MAELRGKHDGKIYRALEELGSGAEGTVYSIVGDSTRVMKIYHDPKPQLISKITEMVESNLKCSMDVSFPEELIFEGNRFRGYVMKRAKGDSFSSIYAISSKKRPISQEVRFTIAKNLCIALSNVHEAGFVFGDFNPANIKVDVSRRTVTLMDTDSFIFGKYGGIVARPEMVPAEIRDAMRHNETLSDGKKRDLPFTKESDIYSLAVHLFRLLMNGEHPFIYKPTKSLSEQPMFAYDLKSPTFPYLKNSIGIAPPPHGIPLESLPLELQTLFVRTFREGYSDPAMRPSIMEFFIEIEEYERSTIQCKVDSVHRYLSSLKSCPFCEAHNRHGQALRGNVPSPVRVSDLEYLFDMGYDFILEHPDKVGLLKRKAFTGCSESLLTLGRLYSDGILGEQDDRKAAENFLKASMAKRPSAEAQYRLALCFLDGIGVPTSKSDAIKWLTLSARSGFESASQLLEYVGQLSPISSSQVYDELNVPMNIKDESTPNERTEVSKKMRHNPQQECIDDVVSGSKDALRALHGFVMSDMLDWVATPSVHEPFRVAADKSEEFAFLYHEIMDKIGNFEESNRYLDKSAGSNYVPALVRKGERYRLLNDLINSRIWYERAKIKDDSIIIPESIIEESLSLEEKPSRFRGSVSLFIDRIKNILGRKKS